MGALWSLVRRRKIRVTGQSAANLDVLPQGSVLHDIEEVSVVWLDADIDRTEDCLDTEVELRRLITYLRTFTDIEQCADYITSLVPASEKVFLIVSGSMGEDLLVRIQDSAAVIRIYVFCENVPFHEQWAKRFSKINGVFDDKNALFSRLLIDLANDAAHLTPMQIFGTDMNQKSIHDLNDQTATFMWFQLLIKVLLKMDDNQDKRARDDLISTCRKRYLGDRIEQARITEFERTYTRKQAIKWYTKNSFLYRSLNRAFRTADIDIIYHFRSIIADIHNQLTSLPRPQDKNLIVYRGQIISTRELQLLEEKKGGFMSMNTFLSTTQGSTEAVGFSKSGTPLPSDLHSVVFEITVKDTKQPFANITHLSSMPTEREILFSVGTVFRIDDVYDMGPMWYVELTLTTEVEQKFENLMNHFENEIGNQPSLYMLGRFLIMQGDYTRAQRYYEFLLNEAMTEKNEKNCAACLNNLGYIAQDIGLIDKAMDYYQKLLDIQKRLLEPGDALLAKTYSNIGTVYTSRGEHDEALKYFQLALSIDLLSMPQNQSEVFISYNNIAHSYNELRDYQSARDNYEKALEIQLVEMGLPTDHPDLAVTFHNLASLYDDMGQHEKAIEYYNRALQIQAVSLPPDHPSRVSTENSIALAYLQLGDYRKAQEKCQQALETKLHMKPPNFPSIARSYCNMGSIFEQKGEYKQALKYFEKALHIQKRFLPANHSDIATTYQNLGSLYDSMGQRDKALDNCQHCIDICRKQEPVNFLILAKAYNTLATIQDDIDKGLEYLTQSVDILKNMKLGNKADLASAYNNLGDFHAGLGHFEVALDYHKKAFDISLEIVKGDTEHLSLVSIYINIGAIQKELGKTREALENTHKALSIRLKTCGDVPHPDLATIYNNLGTIYDDDEQYALALEYFQKALEIFKVSNSDNLLQRAETYQSMAETYDKIGQWEQAVIYQKMTLDLRLSCLKPNDPELADAYLTLALMYETREDYTQSLPLFHKMLDIQIKILPKYDLGLADSYERVGMAHYHNNQSQVALEWILKALKIRQHHGNVPLGYTYQSLAMIYEDLRNLQKASYYYELAIECQLREVVPQEYEDLCFLYLYAGQLYDRLGNTDKAIDYLNETLTLQIEHLEGNNKLRVDTYKAMIKVEEKLGNQVLADDYRNKAQEFEARARSQSAVDNSSSSPR